MSSIIPNDKISESCLGYFFYLFLHIVLGGCVHIHIFFLILTTFSTIVNCYVGGIRLELIVKSAA